MRKSWIWARYFIYLSLMSLAKHWVFHWQSCWLKMFASVVLVGALKFNEERRVLFLKSCFKWIIHDNKTAEAAGNFCPLILKCVEPNKFPVFFFFLSEFLQDTDWYRQIMFYFIPRYYSIRCYEYNTARNVHLFKIKLDHK